MTPYSIPTIPFPEPTSGIPAVVDRETWLSARRLLLTEEKAVTRAHDALNAQRRRLPMVKIEKRYVFKGPNGQLDLEGLFKGRRQLYIHHFMWIDENDSPCVGCTAAADMNFTKPHLAQLHRRDVTFAAVARAPYAKIAALKESRGWSFPFYSSANSDFNHDFGVTLDAGRGPIEYNYRSESELRDAGFPAHELRGDMPGNSVFLRAGDEVYHTYSAYARGLDLLFAPHNFLDLTPYGRQEEWEDSPPGWPKHALYGPDVEPNRNPQNQGINHA